MDRKNLKTERFLYIAFIVLLAGIFLSAFLSRQFLNEYSQMLQDSVSDRIIQTAKSLRDIVTKEELDRLTSPEDENSPLYSDIRERLIAFAEDNNVIFAYFIRQDDDGGFSYIIDNDTENPVGIGESLESDGYIEYAFGGIPISAMFGDYVEDWEGIISAYAPMFDESGQIFAVSAVDISDETILQVINQNRTINIIFNAFLIAVVIVVVFLMDTMRKRAAEYLAASAAKTEFLSNMSHEIRTPMNAIIGLSRMSSMSKDLEEIHSFNEKIIASSSYLLSLLNNILDINKIEAGHMIIENLEFDLSKQLSSVHSMIAPQAEAKSINLRFEIDKTVPARIVSDSTHLTQILMNLLGNAVKFTPPEGTVTLEVKTLNTDYDNQKIQLEFAVSDTGIGIAAENMEKLFRPFEQEDGSTTRKYGGTGLGLTISKNLVEMMGGEIRIDSERNAGSTFSFNIIAGLPESGENASEIVIDTLSADSDGQVLPGCQDKVFLLVEDNDINQMIAKSMLEDYGAIIETANNGLEAVEMFKANPEKYSIIFMDIQMPVMDGYEATRQIRSSEISRSKEIPIIAMTANVFLEDIERAKEAGMDYHIAKPLEPNRLAQAIIKYLDKSPV